MENTHAEGAPQFDFIGDASFRASLSSDYSELLKCMDTGAWKSAHVLAGSVVEAILTDHLLSTEFQRRTGKDPLAMDLASITAACIGEKVITQRTADLTSVVRSYRNLIHPGRTIRLNEKVNNKSALIAKALVDVIASEVAAAKTESYGFTAEQIANKIESDPSSLGVLKHFLNETNERERERLAREVIPERYFLDREIGNGADAAIYQKCYRETLESLPNERKAAVVKRFIKVLKEENGDFVMAYETAFFQAYDLEYLTPNERALAKDHLLSRLKDKDQALGLLDTCEGLGGFLEAQEVGGVVDAYCRVIAYGKTPAVKSQAVDLLSMLYYETSDHQDKIVSRIDEWITFCNEKQMTEAKTSLEGLKVYWSDEIPF